MVMHISKKCSVAVHCLIFINEYGGQKKVTSELLSLSTGCNPVTIRGILSALKKSGIIAVPQGTGGAALQRPPEEISLLQICEAVEPGAIDRLMGVHTTSSLLCPVGRNIGRVLGRTYRRVQDGLADSLRGVTLQEIVDEYHTAADE